MLGLCSECVFHSNRMMVGAVSTKIIVSTFTGKKLRFGEFQHAFWVQIYASYVKKK